MRSIDVGGLSGFSFTCDSPEHAARLRQKMARDLELSATVPPVWQSIRVAGTDFPALVRPGLGSFLFASRGKMVYALTSPSTNALETVFAPAASLLAGASGYDASAADYPMFLDKFDRYGIGSWYPYPWGDKYTKGKPNTIDDHLAFARKFDLTVQPNDGRAALQNLIPKFHQYDRPYHFAQWMDWSPSLAILSPEELFDPSPLFTYATIYYGEVSYGAPKLEQYRNWDWLQSVKQLVADPNLVDWLDPNGEVGAAEWMVDWDFSKNNRANLVRWLRQIKGYSLTQLGEAWYGDAARFKSWEQVPIPHGYDFYGYHAGDILAEKTWRLHTASLDDGLRLGYQKQGMADGKWVAFPMPGGEVPPIEWSSHAPTWYRGSVQVSPDWLKGHAAKGKIFLTVASVANSRGWKNPERLWLNGLEIGALSSKPGGTIVDQVKVTDLLHSGSNSIVYFPSNPDTGILGVFFLTSSPLEIYPFSDSHLNARYVDWKEYCAWAPLAREEDTLKAIRGIDPDRPIKVMAAEDKDLFIPLMAKYGGYPHSTGDGAFLRAWNKRVGYLWGIPGSAELGGPFEAPTEADALKRYFGLFTFQGINAFDQFHNIQDMMYHGVLSDLWAQYLPYFHLANRYDIKKPDIALFFSSRNNRLLARSIPYAFDLGRGDLQSIGYSYVYVDESSLAAGLAASYPVIWDTGTTIMDPATVAHLMSYVENGGTYIAIQDTGRHTLTHRDSWPISELTGFRVREIRRMGGTIAILHDQPLFSKLAGRNFYNTGRSEDYSNYNFADKCLVLEPAAAGTEVLARYQDGTIAAGVRRLGKGRVITLGSPFWRDSYDQLGYWHPGEGQSEFLEDILAGLGLHPLSTSDNHMVWREHYVANNGTEEYLALWNQTDQPQTANLSWRTAHPAAALYDPKTGQSFPGQIAGNTAQIKNLSLKPYETLVLATQNVRVPQECLSDWFHHLALWWRASAPGTATERPALPLYEIELHDGISGAVVSAADYAKLNMRDLSRGLQTEVKFSGDLRFIQPENLGLSVGPEDQVVYRCPFNLPASWKAGDGYFLKFIPAAANRANSITLDLNGQELPAVAINNNLFSRTDIGSRVKFGSENMVVLGTRNGYVGRLVIERQPRALETMAISGPFEVQATEDSGLIPANLPGSFTGLYAVKNDIVIPAKWKGSRVFIRLALGDMAEFSAFAINDKVVFHPVNYDTRKKPTYMDITPWVKLGQANRLLLLPRVAAQTWKPGRLDIQNITLERVTATGQ